jgi:hypothetical protein
VHLQPLEAPQGPQLTLVGPDSHPEPEAPPAGAEGPAEREFLDSADSWTVDAAALPSHMTVTAWLAMCTAMGLTGELRVWRSPSA